MQLFCLQLEASCLQLSFFAYNFMFSALFSRTSWSFFTYNRSLSVLTMGVCASDTRMKDNVS